MSRTAVAAPAKTEAARQLLAGPRGTLPVPLRMLLINVDGRRDEPALLDIARSLGLDDQALQTLRDAGLVTARPARQVDPSARQRRLMRAKMFALDLAARMLAGRDAELRDSARLVDCEASFLVWLADACAHIEAVASAERAQVYRERVVAAAAGG